MRREIWIASVRDAEKMEQLDSLYMACEIVKAMASDGSSKWGEEGAAKVLEKTYQKIEALRKAIK